MCESMQPDQLPLWTQVVFQIMVHFKMYCNGITSRDLTRRTQGTLKLVPVLSTTADHDELTSG